MSIKEDYYQERENKHDEVRVTVKKMIHDWGLKIAIRGGYWTVHKDPWYQMVHNKLITIVHMGFRRTPQVTVNKRGYEDLAQQIADYLKEALVTHEKRSTQ